MNENIEIEEAQSYEIRVGSCITLKREEKYAYPKNFWRVDDLLEAITSIKMRQIEFIKVDINRDRDNQKVIFNYEKGEIEELKSEGYIHIEEFNRIKRKKDEEEAKLEPLKDESEST